MVSKRSHNTDPVFYQRFINTLRNKIVQVLYWKQLENKQEVKHSRFMKMEQLYSPTRRLQR